MPDERIEILRKVTLFDGLSDKELGAIAKATKERRFDTGDVIVSEGESGIGFFVIADGTARVEAKGTRVATLMSGSSFGEVALLDDGVGRRTATVIAESQLRVFGLTAWQFTPLLDQYPALAVKIAAALPARCARRRNGRPPRAGASC